MKNPFQEPSRIIQIKNGFTFIKIENCTILFQNVLATQCDNIVHGNKYYYFIQNMGDKKTLHTTIQMHKKSPFWSHT